MTLAMPALYKYQVEDVAALAVMPRHILAHDPGLGKTAIVIRALCKRFGKYDAPRFLVVCSKTAMQTWQAEIKTWDLRATHRPVVLLPDGSRARKIALARYADGWLVINREALRLFIDDLVAIDFSAVVVDEVHHFRSRPIQKNKSGANRSQATAALFRLKASTRYAISATLTDGDPRDLWPTLRWLWPKSFGSYWAWALKYCEFEDDGYSMYGTYKQPQNAERMRARLAPLMLRRTKAEAAPDLPPLIETIVPLELSPAERKHYDEMESDMLTVFETGTFSASSKVAQLTRLQQLATFYAPLGSTKLDWVMDFISGFPQGKQLVIASHFREPLFELSRHLSACGITTAMIIGGALGRGAVVSDFQAGKIRVLLMTISSGGESITLSAADTMIALDRTWSSIEWTQLVSRLHRNDEKTKTHQSINVYSLVAMQTIDEEVQTLVERKIQANDQMIVSTSVEQMRQRQNKILKKT